MTSHPRSIPDPTYVDKFGLYLASGLICSHKLIRQLKQATADVTSFSSGSASPRRVRSRCGSNPSETASTKPIRLYWRTPILHRALSKKQGCEEISSGGKEDSSGHVTTEKVLFIDVTFNFLLPEASSSTLRNNHEINTSSSSSTGDHGILLPRVQVQFGALVQQILLPSSGQNPLEDCDQTFIGSAKYVLGAPVIHSDLILHAQQVGIDLEGTTPLALANLMAGALVCSSSHRASVISRDNAIIHGGEATGFNSKEKEEYAVKLLLAYDDFGGEEGELLIHPSSPDGTAKDCASKMDKGFIGGLALEMLLTNLERQDNDFDSKHYHSQHDGSGDEANGIMDSQNIEYCAAVEEAFQSWWESAYDGILLRYQKNNATKNGPISKLLDVDLNCSNRGSSKPALSSPRREQKAMGKTKMVTVNESAPKTQHLDQDAKRKDSLQEAQNGTNGSVENRQQTQSATGEPLQKDEKVTEGSLSIDITDDTTVTCPTKINCNLSQNQVETNTVDCTCATSFSLSASLPLISPPPKMYGNKRRKASATRQRGRGVLVLGNSSGGRGSKRRKRGRITIGG